MQPAHTLASNIAEATGDFLDFANVSVVRDGAKILCDIDLRISTDENVAIIGPNGSGKSTLIKLITRKIYPSYTSERGHLRLFGESSWVLEDLRVKLGIVTNELQYDFHKLITGFECILSGFFASTGLYNVHNTDAKMRTTAHQMAELLEVSHLENRTLDTLSSGEARRFLIARALVNNPKVLVLDEPTNSLDIATAIKFHATLRNIAGHDTKIVLVTHLVSDIIPEINRFVLLKDGKIFDDGSRVDTFTSAKLSRLFGIDIDLLEGNVPQVVMHQ
ncbi:MAG: ATP-binding cassette domain-containing protein [Bifidobacteriaceae bacterium]|jgi:iron complex transport system ATP-binding protein|nr:ATP-binding cassette domain-containing protein [Bifidobacteriaceae bacterium]